MTYQLILADPPVEGQIKKDVGENVFLAELPADYKVFAFYYAGAMANEKLEERLRSLGNMAGKNLFVNIGHLNDPQYDKIERRFAIEKLPVIIVTALDTLASPPDEHLTAFARLDNKHLLDSPERATECVQQLFNLFIQGKVREAMSEAKWQQRQELLIVLGNFFAAAFKPVGDLIFKRDISISVLEGKFELKQHGK
jgi:hypothetical protein